MTLASSFTNDFNKTLNTIGFVGSFFVGSLITFNDYGDEVVTNSLVSGSLYMRPLNQRELSVRAEGGRIIGKNVAYVHPSVNLNNGSQYQFVKSSDTFDVVEVNSFELNGVVVYHKIILDKVNSN